MKSNLESTSWPGYCCPGRTSRRLEGLYVFRFSQDECRLGDRAETRFHRSRAISNAQPISETMGGSRRWWASTLHSRTDRDPRNELQDWLRGCFGGGVVPGGGENNGKRRNRGKATYCHRHIGTAGWKNLAPRELFPRSLGGSRLQ